MIADYHIHTNNSIDASTTVQQVLKLVEEANVQIFSITDHDSIKSNYEILELFKNKYGCVNSSTCENFKPKFVTGIELSTTQEKKWIHILGLNIDIKNKTFLNKLNALEKMHFNHAKMIVQKVENMGYKFDSKLLKKLFENQLIFGKPQIADVLVESGSVNSHKDAYQIIDPIIFENLVLLPKDAIKIIKLAGGLSVLAHPIEILSQLNNDKLKFEIILEGLCKDGLDAIEVYTPRQNEEFCRYLTLLARKHNLLISGGSDFHGKNRHNNDNIGKYTTNFNKITITEKLLAELKEF